MDVKLPWLDERGIPTADPFLDDEDEETGVFGGNEVVGKEEAEAAETESEVEVCSGKALLTSPHLSTALLLFGCNDNDDDDADEGGRGAAEEVVNGRRSR
jgi:hypothetical protein